MKTILEHIRDRVEGRAKLDQLEIGKGPSLETLYRTEWSSYFESLMRNRLIMGALRYGRLGTHKPLARTEAMISKVKGYEETGNLEYLVDVANYALIEFVEGQHPKKHFHATDDKDHARRTE